MAVPSTVSVKSLTVGFRTRSSNGPSKSPGASFDVYWRNSQEDSFKITPVGQLVEQMASERLESLEL